MLTEPTYTETEAHLYFAKACNRRVWALVRQASRTPDEDADMLDAAHASLYHWRHVGTGINLQRGEWLIGHVHALLGNGEAALRHATRCLELTNTYRNEMEDFDIAFADLGMARAHALLGNRADAQAYFTRAEQAGNAIADDEDRSIFIDDLNSGEWYGLR